MQCYISLGKFIFATQLLYAECGIAMGSRLSAYIVIYEVSILAKMCDLE